MSKKLNPDGVAPQTFALHGGYDPAEWGGSVKPPTVASSTFVPPSAEALKHAFDVAYGRVEPDPAVPVCDVYARVDTPTVRLFEQRWSVYERAEASMLTSSGMAAISTTMMALCAPGDAVLLFEPVYGGTHHFMMHVLKKWGVEVICVPIDASGGDLAAKASGQPELWNRIKVAYLETPTNPTLQTVDLHRVCADLHRLLGVDLKVVVDNTLLGPVYCQPLRDGADLVIHSATKSIGGHSDLVAGIVSGSEELIRSIRAHRTILGSNPDARVAALLLRSLETYRLRVQAMGASALEVVRFLQNHPKVREVLYAPRGSLISVRLNGDEAAAYRFLNALGIIKLAVSLGGTESLAEHPRTHTHSDMSQDVLDVTGITPNLVRISIGLESVHDLIQDLEQALQAV